MGNIYILEAENDRLREIIENIILETEKQSAEIRELLNALKRVKDERDQLREEKKKLTSIIDKLVDNPKKTE